MICQTEIIHGERGIGINRVRAVERSNGRRMIPLAIGVQAVRWQMTSYKAKLRENREEGGKTALFLRPIKVGFYAPYLTFTARFA